MSSISLNDPRAVRPDTAAAKSDRAAHPLTNWHSKHHETLTPGQRAADRLRNWMGSWLFIGGFLLFMVVWAAMNAMSFAWDPYPFILLNLFLSMLAGLQGAILLISAKRQDGISAALAQHDFETNIATKQELEELMEMNRLQLALMRELHSGRQTDGARARDIDRPA
ncbi:Acid-resistant locus arl7 (Fragment) [Microbacterium esteraromaticum]|uniref:Acid-resistant locus arl7 n=1 Tax=Microbacterium esteraromaticum TaxID=57043 RepID=A0A1R4JX18_9MICO